jgi:hypothetical protein
MTSKKTNQRNHARKRAGERYELGFRKDERKYFVREIQGGRAVFLEKSSHRVSKFAVKYEGEWYPVVYDKNRKEIITFLPPDSLRKYSGRLEESFG